MWGRGQWIIDSNGIPFADYPFFPATVFPAATIAWEQVDDIDPLAPPPTVRVGAELLMVSAVHASCARSAQRRADRPRRAVARASPDSGTRIWSYTSW